MQQIIFFIVTVGLSTSLAYYFSNKSKRAANDSSEAPLPQLSPEKIIEEYSLKEKIVFEARAKAKEIIFEAKNEVMQSKSEADKRLAEVKDKAAELEKSLAVQKSKLEEKEKEIENKARQVRELKDAIEKRKDQIDQLYKQQQDKLEKTASLTKEEARQELLVSFDRDLSAEKGKRIRQIEEEIKKDIEKKAQELLIDAMRFGATDYVVEYTTSKVKIPDEDIKGRIIGKEGRNIKMFEELTGVELELDTSPGEIIISSFDPVRREIAKTALERLMKDGRIQPVKIEETIDKTQKEIEHLMFKEGDNLCHRVGIYDLPKELIQMLGRFKYRFSYGQNLIEHTLEETRIGAALATELGLDVYVVKMGCLLHDIGKVVTDEEGTHVQLGVELLKKYKIDEKVVNCVAEHHEDRPFSSLESSVVALADHISGARPGARSEDYESYVKRMKDLEAAATSFDGVDKAYAISAGREVRVFVIPSRVDDDSAALIAREIAKKIELEQTYPGVVKVTVIRETRVSETAK